MGQYYKALVKTADGTRHVFSPQTSAYEAKHGAGAYQVLHDEHFRKNPDGSVTYIPYPEEYSRASEGLKMMEHAWFGRPFVNGVLATIADGPAQVAWVGDYANEDEDYERIAGFSPDDYEACWSYDSDMTEPFAEMPDGSVRGYLVNLDKGVYLDLAEISMLGGSEAAYGRTTHPLPVLTAIGNGRGGGDYYGTNMGKVGTWAMDRLQFVLDEPTEMERGESDDYIFDEQ